MLFRSYQLADLHQRWLGRLDVFTINGGGRSGAAAIRVTAEPTAIDLMRPLVSLYSDAEQRRLHPGDPSLQYMVDQQDVRIVWPAASWGRR